MFRFFEQNNNSGTSSFLKKISIGTALAATNFISYVYSSASTEWPDPDFQVMFNHTFTFPFNESYYSTNKLSCWGWVPAEYWSNFTSALLTCNNTLINNISFVPSYNYYIHRRDFENPNIYCHYRTSDPMMMDDCTYSTLYNYIEYPSLPPWQPLTPIEPAPSPHPADYLHTLLYLLGAGAGVSACLAYYLAKKCFQKPIDEHDFLDPVFWEIMENPMKLDCGHRLDQSTLEQLIPNEKAICTCPLCRSEIKNPKPDNEIKELIIAHKNKNETPGKFSILNMFSYFRSSGQPQNEEKSLLDKPHRSLMLNS